MSVQFLVDSQSNWVNMRIFYLFPVQEWNECPFSGRFITGWVNVSSNTWTENLGPGDPRCGIFAGFLWLCAYFTSSQYKSGMSVQFLVE
jgi:hypothetical protein